MPKKSQAQVFTYIAALIIAGAVVLLGYKGVGSLLEAGERAALARLQQTLKSEINDTALSYGSIRTLQLELPSGSTGICFIDRSQSSCSGISYPLIEQSCNNNRLTDNAFLLPDGSEKFAAGGIKVYVNDAPAACTCFAAKGRTVSVRIKGEGNAAGILGKDGCGSP